MQNPKFIVIHNDGRRVELSEEAVAAAQLIERLRADPTTAETANRAIAAMSILENAKVALKRAAEIVADRTKERVSRN